MTGQNYIISVSAVNNIGESCQGFTTSQALENSCAPNSPIIYFDKSNNVVITWTAPQINGGLPITGYKVLAKNKKLNERDYAQITCTFSPLSNTQCTIPLTSLRTTPYSVDWGDTFCIKAVAQTSQGDSNCSLLAKSSKTGQDCERLLTKPDAPVYLRNDPTQSTCSKLGLQWENGVNNGGASILFHQIYYRNTNAGQNDWVMAEQRWEGGRQYAFTNLNIGSTYEFKINAWNSEGASDFSNVLNSQFNCPTKPDHPYGLKEIQANTDCRQITFEWITPNNNGNSPIINYNVKHYAKGSDSNSAYTESTTQTRFTTSKGIQAGKTYMVSVIAQNSVGSSFASDEIEIVAATCPSKPISLKSSSSCSDAKQISLTWEAGNEGCVETQDYVLWMSTPPGSFEIKKASIKETTTTITGLKQGTEYGFYVQARNAKCSSPTSDPIKQYAAQKPQPPNNLKISYDKLGSFTFTWTDRDNGGGPIQYYTLFFKNNKGILKQVQCKNNAQQTCSVSAEVLKEEKFGVNWGDTITVSVTATNDRCTSDPSIQIDFLFLTCPPAPKIINKIKADETSITLQFEDGTIVGPNRIIDYRVKQKLRSQSEWQVIYPNLLIESDQKIFVSRELVYREIYQWTIEARNSQCYSEISNIWEEVFEPQVCPNKPLSFECIGCSSKDNIVGTSASLAWAEPARKNRAPILDYNLYMRVKTEADQKDFEYKQQFITSPSFTVSGLVLGNTYEFIVKARNKDCESDPSSILTLKSASVPVTPTCPTITFDKKHYVISWAEPQNGGSIITGYNVILKNTKGIKLSQETSDCASSIQSSLTSCKIPAVNILFLPYNLNVGDYFIASVSANNAQGTSLFSCDSEPQKVFNCPNPPTLLQNDIQQTSDSQICLTWKDGRSNGGLDITGYIIKVYTDVQMSKLRSSQQVDPSMKKACISLKITANERYHVVVVAKNQMCDSLDSLPLVIVAQKYAERPEKPIVSIDLEDSKPTEIKLKWEAPSSDSGAPIIGYRILWKREYDAKFQEFIIPTKQDQLSYTLTNLGPGNPILPGENYFLQIYAINRIGEGQASNEISVFTAGPPSKPIMVSFQVSQCHQKVFVTWSKPLLNNASTIIGYKVEIFTKAETFVAKNCVATDSLSTQCTLSISEVLETVELGKKLIVRVIALSTKGDSQPSDSFSQILAFAPDAPRNLRSVNTNANQIGLLWEVPAKDNGAVVDQYMLYWRNEGTCIKQAADYDQNQCTQNLPVGFFAHATYGAEQLSTLISQFKQGIFVEEGSTYSFIVQARNSAGWGIYSTPITILAQSIPSSVKNVIVTMPEPPNHQQLTLKWDAPENNLNLVTKYVVQVQVPQEQDKSWLDIYCIFKTPTSTECKVLLSDLDNAPYNQKYGDLIYFRITTIGTSGNSGPSEPNKNTLYAITPHQPIKIIADYSVTSSRNPLQIKLNWQEPIQNGGLTVTAYRIWFEQNGIYRLLKSDTIQTKTVTMTEQFTINPNDQVIKIEQGQTYTFQVQAYNEAGWGERSNPIDVKPGQTVSCSQSNTLLDYTQNIQFLDADDQRQSATDGKFFGLGCLTGVAASFVLIALIKTTCFLYTRRNGRPKINQVASECQAEERKVDQSSNFDDTKREFQPQVISAV